MATVNTLQSSTRLDQKIAIFGAGGFGREVKTIIDAINKTESNTYNFVGFYDDGIEKGTIVNGYPLLGGIQELNEVTSELSLIISIGDPRIKKIVLNKIETTILRCIRRITVITY